jgi:hypothetical protein
LGVWPGETERRGEGGEGGVGSGERGDRKGELLLRFYPLVSRIEAQCLNIIWHDVMHAITVTKNDINCETVMAPVIAHDLSPLTWKILVPYHKGERIQESKQGVDSDTVIVNCNRGMFCRTIESSFFFRIL